MPETEIKSQGTQPPPTGHPQPRRTTAANSVTLRHHRLARDASRNGSRSSPRNSTAVSSPRRNSSGDSHVTGQSDPNNWFEQSNENPAATFDSTAMDVDPPFFQKESYSSNEDRPFPYQVQLAGPKASDARSSSADDYRSVIDDLTIEIQKLKEELKRYKQDGPNTMRKDKLFEIKFHGLPKRKKRELETTLRDFAAGLGSSSAASSHCKNSSRHATRDNMHSASGSISKHASSSSGSNFRPVDSAYASMSIGAQSSGPSLLGRPTGSARAKSSDQKVTSYLRDIPEGLYPRNMTIPEREKKKLVVRRLEQLFTGQTVGRQTRAENPAATQSSSNALAPVTSEAGHQKRVVIHEPPSLTAEPAREARILPTETQSDHQSKKNRSRDNESTSNSNGDQIESGGNGNSSTPSPTMPPPPEQRPTRPKDLDPDRIQVPSDNMEYIRHLGLVPPELPKHSKPIAADVHHDADGWVYLNLLCSLAQLHIINVTPSFVLSAVSDYSTKFQISPDGRKIRWRGGPDGTKFHSDSSGENSLKSPETDDSMNGDDRRKRQRTGYLNGEETQTGDSSKHMSKFGPQITASSEGFHYKPLFAQQTSPNALSSMDDTLSSFGPVEDSNAGDSKWGLSGSGSSPRKRRRHDGAVIYYSGAPFCMDLSGDPGDTSPSYMMSGSQDRPVPAPEFARPLPMRSESGSFLAYRPLSEMTPPRGPDSKMDLDGGNREVPVLATHSSDHVGEPDMEFPWSDEQQFIDAQRLEPSGLGGVLPEDHFMVVATTKRPKEDFKAPHSSGQRTEPKESTNGMIRRLVTMSASSSIPTRPVLPPQSESPTVEIEYLSGRIKRLAPTSLPPPAIFLPPFSDSSSSDSDGSEEEEESDDGSSKLMSCQANPHRSDGYPDGHLSSGDEDGEDPDDEPDTLCMYDREVSHGHVQRQSDILRRASGSAVAAAGTVSGRSKSASAERTVNIGSSVATAGGVESGYSSRGEESGYRE